MSEKENNTEPAPGSSDGVGTEESVGPVYGYLLVWDETHTYLSNIFGIKKNVITIGRGSKNDIRLNARMFSRLHCTITISEIQNGVKVELKNESQQKNATRLLDRMVPFENSVELYDETEFFLQGRQFKWLEDLTSNEFVKTAQKPVEFIMDSDDPDQSLQNPTHVVEHTGLKHGASSPSGIMSPSKKRRGSFNVSLELRKAAHRHSFKSAVQQQQSGRASSTMTKILEEDGNETETEQSAKDLEQTSDLIIFSPEPQTDSPLPIENNDKSLIDFTSAPSSPIVSLKSSEHDEKQHDASHAEEPVVNNRIESPTKRRTSGILTAKQDVVASNSPRRSLSLQTNNVSEIEPNLNTVEEAIQEQTKETPTRRRSSRIGTPKKDMTPISTPSKTVKTPAAQDEVSDSPICSTSILWKNEDSESVPETLEDDGNKTIPETSTPRRSSRTCTPTPSHNMTSTPSKKAKTTAQDVVSESPICNTSLLWTMTEDSVAVENEVNNTIPEASTPRRSSRTCTPNASITTTPSRKVEPTVQDVVSESPICNTSILWKNSESETNKTIPENLTPRRSSRVCTPKVDVASVSTPAKMAKTATQDMVSESPICNTSILWTIPEDSVNVSGALENDVNKTIPESSTPRRSSRTCAPTPGHDITTTPSRKVNKTAVQDVVSESPICNTSLLWKNAEDSVAVSQALENDVNKIIPESSTPRRSSRTCTLTHDVTTTPSKKANNTVQDAISESPICNNSFLLTSPADSVTVSGTLENDVNKTIPDSSTPRRSSRTCVPTPSRDITTTPSKKAKNTAQDAVSDSPICSTSILWKHSEDSESVPETFNDDGNKTIPETSTPRRSSRTCTPTPSHNMTSTPSKKTKTKVLDVVSESPICNTSILWKHSEDSVAGSGALEKDVNKTVPETSTPRRSSRTCTTNESITTTPSRQVKTTAQVVVSESPICNTSLLWKNSEGSVSLSETFEDDNNQTILESSTSRRSSRTCTPSHGMNTTPSKNTAQDQDAVSESPICNTSILWKHSEDSVAVSGALEKDVNKTVPEGSTPRRSGRTCEPAPSHDMTTTPSKKAKNTTQDAVSESPICNTSLLWTIPEGSVAVSQALENEVNKTIPETSTPRRSSRTCTPNDDITTTPSRKVKSTVQDVVSESPICKTSILWKNSEDSVSETIESDGNKTIPENLTPKRSSRVCTPKVAKTATQDLVSESPIGNTPFLCTTLEDSVAVSRALENDVNKTIPETSTPRRSSRTCAPTPSHDITTTPSKKAKNITQEAVSESPVSNNSFLFTTPEDTEAVSGAVENDVNKTIPESSTPRRSSRTCVPTPSRDITTTPSKKSKNTAQDAVSDSPICSTSILWKNSEDSESVPETFNDNGNKTIPESPTPRRSSRTCAPTPSRTTTSTPSKKAKTTAPEDSGALENDVNKTTPNESITTTPSKKENTTAQVVVSDSCNTSILWKKDAGSAQVEGSNGDSNEEKTVSTPVRSKRSVKINEDNKVEDVKKSSPPAKKLRKKITEQTEEVLEETNGVDSTPAKRTPGRTNTAKTEEVEVEEKPKVEATPVKRTRANTVEDSVAVSDPVLDVEVNSSDNNQQETTSGPKSVRTRRGIKISKDVRVEDEKKSSPPPKKSGKKKVEQVIEAEEEKATEAAPVKRTRGAANTAKAEEAADVGAVQKVISGANNEGEAVSKPVSSKMDNEKEDEKKSKNPSPKKSRKKKPEEETAEAKQENVTLQPAPAKRTRGRAATAKIEEVVADVAAEQKVGNRDTNEQEADSKPARGKKGVKKTKVNEVENVEKSSPPPKKLRTRKAEETVEVKEDTSKIEPTPVKRTRGRTNTAKTEEVEVEEEKLRAETAPVKRTRGRANKVEDTVAVSDPVLDQEVNSADNDEQETVSGPKSVRSRRGVKNNKDVEDEKKSSPPPKKSGKKKVEQVVQAEEEKAAEAVPVKRTRGRANAQKDEKVAEPKPVSSKMDNEKEDEKKSSAPPKKTRKKKAEEEAKQENVTQPTPVKRLRGRAATAKADKDVADVAAAPEVDSGDTNEQETVSKPVRGKRGAKKMKDNEVEIEEKSSPPPKKSRPKKAEQTVEVKEETSKIEPTPVKRTRGRKAKADVADVSTAQAEVSNEDNNEEESVSKPVRAKRGAKKMKDNEAEDAKKSSPPPKKLRKNRDQSDKQKEVEKEESKVEDTPAKRTRGRPRLNQISEGKAEEKMTSSTTTQRTTRQKTAAKKRS